MDEGRIEKGVVKLYNMNGYEILEQDLENHMIIADDEDGLVFTKWFWQEHELPKPEWTRDEFKRYAIDWLANHSDRTDFKFRADVVNVALLGEDRAAMEHIVNYPFE